MREPFARKAWYLAVVDPLARTDRLETVSITGLRWWEVDRPEDLVAVRHGLATGPRSRAAVGAPGPAAHAPRQRARRNERCASGC